MAERTDRRAVILLALGGITAAMHIGKAAIALPVLQSPGTSPRLDDVTAAWLLATPGVVGALGSLAIGAALPAVGVLRAFRLGLLTAAAASAAGAFASGSGALLLTRAVESLAGVVVVVAAPVLLATVVAPTDRSLALGLWGAYMPIGQALVILLGAGLLTQWSWTGLWWITAVASMTMVAMSVIVLPPGGAGEPSYSTARRDARPRTARRDWLGLALLGGIFCAYTTQWMAVVGYLPSIFDGLGLVLWVAGVATAVVLLGNAAGNLVAGVLLRRRVAPARVLRGALCVMLVAGILVFVPKMPALVTGIAAFVFSSAGGAVPGTLFGITATMTAPGPSARSSFLVQGAQTGAALGPLMVGSLVVWAGGWHAAAFLMFGVGFLGLTLLFAWTRWQPEQVADVTSPVPTSSPTPSQQQG